MQRGNGLGLLTDLQIAIGGKHLRLQNLTLDTRSPQQSEASFNEQKLAIEVVVKATNKYKDVGTALTLT